MKKKFRYSILVQLTDGELGAEQADAIREACLPGESVSAMCRRVLLGHVGRLDLHRVGTARRSSWS